MELDVGQIIAPIVSTTDIQPQSGLLRDSYRRLIEIRQLGQEVNIRALLNQSRTLFSFGNDVEADRLVREAIELARHLQNRQLIAKCANRMNWMQVCNDRSRPPSFMSDTELSGRYRQVRPPKDRDSRHAQLRPSISKADRNSSISTKSSKYKWLWNDVSGRKPLQIDRYQTLPPNTFSSAIDDEPKVGFLQPENQQIHDTNDVPESPFEQQPDAVDQFMQMLRSNPRARPNMEDIVRSRATQQKQGCSDGHLQNSDDSASSIQPSPENVHHNHTTTESNATGQDVSNNQDDLPPQASPEKRKSKID